MAEPPALGRNSGLVIGERDWGARGSIRAVPPGTPPFGTVSTSTRGGSNYRSSMEAHRPRTASSLQSPLRSASPCDISLGAWTRQRQQHQQQQQQLGISSIGPPAFGHQSEAGRRRKDVGIDTSTSQWHPATLDLASAGYGGEGGGGGGTMRCGNGRYTSGMFNSTLPSRGPLGGMRYDDSTGIADTRSSLYHNSPAPASCSGGVFDYKTENRIFPEFHAVMPPASSFSAATCPSRFRGASVPRRFTPGLGNPDTTDDHDEELQEALRQSLEEADRQKKKEDAEFAQALALAVAAEEAQQRKKSEQAEYLSKVEQAAAKCGKSKKREQPIALRRSTQSPLPPPPGLADTFGPGQWLNDASIALAYAQLAAGGGTAGGRGSPLPEAVLLMDPATAFWLTLQEDPKQVEEVKDALKLHERQLVLCPINDSSDGSRADTGTHWTLLVCWNRCYGRAGFKTSSPVNFTHFYYYDSLLGGSWTSGGANLTQARTLASRLAGRVVRVLPDDCPKQTNCFDCGIYVLLFSEIIVTAILEAEHSHASTTSCSSPSAYHTSSCSLPVWQSRVASVTPMEVSARRATYFESFSADASTDLGMMSPHTAPACKTSTRLV